MKNVFAVFVFILAIVRLSPAQTPQFRNPLDIPIQLAANFGEIRTDHYHTGYDIRTNGKTGYKVYASASGYISRIKVSPFGFGRVLYITHPNGFMTVYGHLDRFNDTIGKFVKEQQYAKKNFEVEIFPEPGKFPVKQGDLIAYSGNSGGSTGPHLHFEIRDASGESYPLNPENFLPLQDHQPARFSALYVYPLENCCSSHFSNRYRVTGSGSQFAPASDTVIVDFKTIGLATDVEDFIDGSANDLGVYELQAAFDNNIIFSMKMDRFTFDNGRYVNAHIDYGEWRKNGSLIQKLFLLPGDRNNIYHNIPNRGKIDFQDTLVHNIQITAKDVSGNTSVLSFKIKYSGTELPDSAELNYEATFKFDQANKFETDSMRVVLPAYSLYDNLHFRYSKDLVARKKSLSSVYHVHDPLTPLHSSGELYLLPRKMSDGMKSKALIVYEKPSGGLIGKTSRWEGNFLTTKIRDFGNYFVSFDTTAPVISPIAIKQGQVIKRNEIHFRVDDNLSGVTSYNAYLDGKWCLMEFNPKDDELICFLETNLVVGNHELKIEVKDEMNNESSYVLKFKK